MPPLQQSFDANPAAGAELSDLENVGYAGPEHNHSVPDDDPLVVSIRAMFGPHVTFKAVRTDGQPEQPPVHPSEWRVNGLTARERLDMDLRRDGHGVYLDRFRTTIGERLWRNGWTCFPQGHSDGRLPGFYGRRLPNSTMVVASKSRIKWGEFHLRRPDLAAVHDMRDANHWANTAMVTGAVSGHVWSLDADIDDPDIAAAVLDVAREHLGETPFVRTRSNSSRWMAIYRFDPADSYRGVDVSPLRKGKINTGHGDLEILGQASTGNGSPITIYGRHHGGQVLFEWPEGCGPLDLPPTAAPVVSEAAYKAFVAALKKKLGIVDAPKVMTVVEPARYDGEVYVPGGAASVPGVDYAPDDGRVRRHREEWLFKRSMAWHMANPAAAHDVKLARLLQEADRYLRFDGVWSHDAVARNASAKLAALAIKFPADHVSHQRSYSGEEGAVYSPRFVDVAATSDEDVVALAGKHLSAVKLYASTAVDAALATRLAFRDAASRAEETGEVHARVVQAVKRWLDLLWDKKDAVEAGESVEAIEAEMAKVFLLVAPTGAGKTSTFLRLLTLQIAERGPLGGPVVLMMPSYQNIEENQQKLAGYVTEASSVGLSVETWEGKARRCRIAEKMLKLMEFGIGTVGMCKREVDAEETDEEEEAEVEGGRKPKEFEYCDHYDDCESIAARKRALTCDLLFVPTAFLSLELPKELKDAIAGVCVDERCWTGLIEHRTFPLETLTFPRARGYATKKEKAATGLKGKEAKEAAIDALHHDRNEAARIATEALKAGRDVASVFAAFSNTYEGKLVTGRELVANAARVCGRAGDRRKDVRPNMTGIAVDAVVEKGTGTDLWPEKAFWDRVKERIESLDRKTAKGDRDYRIQIQDRDSAPQIRVSWRTDSTLKGHPTMLMDASASPHIVEKLWDRREVETIQIDASLHMRVVWCPDQTWATSAYVPAKAGDDETKLARACLNLTKLRGITGAMAGLFGWGRILVGGAKAGVVATHDRWAANPNVDHAWFNAVAGLDFAKDHLAALIVGRLELPVGVVDAIVAALTYDDDEPEAPMDRGDGLDRDGKDIRPNMVPRTMQLRDGSTATVMIPQHAGAWARIVQAQFREEQQRQMIGRLRPVYRQGEPPLVVVLSSVIPADLVVDEIVHSDDLLSSAKVWGSVRRTGALNARVATYMTPDLRATLEVAAMVAEIEKVGMTHRAAKGLVKLDVQVSGGGHDTLYIPAYCDTRDVKEQWSEIFRGTRKVVDIVPVAWGADPVPSQARPEDPRFVEAVGDIDARRTAEKDDRTVTVCGLTTEELVEMHRADMAVGPLRGSFAARTLWRRAKA